MPASHGRITTVGVSLNRFSEVIRLERQLLDNLLERMQHDMLVEIASAGSSTATKVDPRGVQNR